ncbi:hypothetical protein [Clostridium grantii]|uniref:Uncharacterized protein n=1 Tax=Clostridium grantii DSM 8605 TaxID=1121316 RepID=A0A1M5U7Q7_9CLOT|nr:hypothetical protein [Clostridium grantii]SHH58989.1 hypothetical protein SAMN02745207_01625 [Clostridium grantii DSM 8605]
MSYKEALKDGIRIENNGKRTRYYPRCQFCGYEVQSYNYIPDYNYTCTECRKMKTTLLKTGIFTPHSKE